MADRLSDLPDRTLHQILSRLPFRQQVRTDILSTRWRRLWSSNPVLRFDQLNFSSDDTELDTEDFVAIIDHCLRLCSRPEKLQALFLPSSGGPALASALPGWIRFAAGRNVAELVLRIFSVGRPFAKLPFELFSCRDLVVLKLECCTFPNVNFRAARGRLLQALNTLVLHNVDITAAALRTLLNLCSSIEHLILKGCYPGRVAIKSQTMKSLVVRFDSDGTLQLEIVAAPQLRKLVYCSDILNIRSLEGAPNLEEAAIFSSVRSSFKDQGRWWKFLYSIAHVKSLSVNTWFFEFSLYVDPGTGSSRGPFENLRELHWWPVHEGFPFHGERFTLASLRMLISSLRALPSLELLCVHRKFYREKRAGDRPFDLSDTWTDPLQEFEGVGYVLPQLKTLKVVEFSGERKETRMVEFLLDKAVALESLVLYYVPKVAGELGRMKAAISAMRKASPLVRIRLLELPDDTCPKAKDDLKLLSQFLNMNSKGQVSGPESLPGFCKFSF